MKGKLFFLFGLAGFSALMLFEVLILNALLEFDWKTAESEDYLFFLVAATLLNASLIIIYSFLEIAYGFSKKLV